MFAADAESSEDEMENRAGAFLTDADRVTSYKNCEKKFGRCKLCGNAHTYNRKVAGESMIWPSERLTSCDRFVKMSLEQKAEFLEAKGCCPRCLSWNHQKDQCKVKPPTCGLKLPNGEFCLRDHHRSMHHSKSQYCDAAAIVVEVHAAEAQDARVLLAVQELPLMTDHGQIVAKGFWDSGATICLCTHDWATRNGLTGVDTSLYLKVIQHVHEQVDSKRYDLLLTDIRGDHWKIRAFGVDSISMEQEYVPPPELIAKYPELTVQQMSRSAGEIDLLLGMDVVGLHPVTIRSEGNQRLLNTKFGVGKLLVGCVPGTEVQQVNASAARLSRGSWDKPVNGVVHRVQAWPAPLYQPGDAAPYSPISTKNPAAQMASSVEAVEKAWQEEMKDMEPRALRSCRKCAETHKHCPQCNFRARGLSELERKSVTFMQERMQHDQIENCIRVEYPLVTAAERQPNNFAQVRTIQQNIEKRTDKEGLREAYNTEMQRMLDAKAVKELSDQEMRQHTGGVHYMPHFPVMNPDSASTPLCIVVDSKCVNKRSGLAFNDLIAPVPNALNDILDVILRWRQFPTALVYDLSKAYHTLRTGPRELHLRRFLYRFDSSSAWKSYGYVVVAFGE